MADIQVMTEADFEFAVSLTDHEEWGNLGADFARLTALQPDGCFIAWEDGERIGMVSTTVCGDYAFMGSLIVRPDRRGRGVGEALMRHALEYLIKGSIACIELDATFPAAPLYRRLGFRDKFLSLRFVRPGDKSTGVYSGNPSSENVDTLASIVTRIDKHLTGLDRSRLLARLATEFPESVFVEGSQKPQGYAIVYPRSGNRVNIGPLVAADGRTAERLLDAIIEANASHDISAGVPETQTAASRMMLDRGFLYHPPSLRMYHGQQRRFEEHIYAIVSAEKG